MVITDIFSWGRHPFINAFSYCSSILEKVSLYDSTVFLSWRSVNGISLFLFHVPGCSLGHTGVRCLGL